MGPDQVVVVRSDYRIGEYNCPNYNPSAIGNPNEASMPGFGCADAYNMGQMLARPRDAAIGRPAGPADGTVSAAAVQRYHEGRVRAPQASATTSGGAGAGGGGGATATSTP
jgi:type IV pilus biogenesis protein CpaD/CtpE